MVLRVNGDDDHSHSPLIAGMEDVDIDQVLRMRECTLTDQPFQRHGSENNVKLAFPKSMTDREIREQIFHGGKLTCRMVYIQYFHGRNGMSYSGVVRHLYAHEADSFRYCKRKHRTRAVRSRKKDPLSFGDGFCGTGGASQGASQAGFVVKWGFDNNDRACKAYELNHPSAYSLKMDAHDFPPEGISKDAWRVDVLHVSPPCRYFSPAQ
jgi:DNA (cytosine-5)-methyltransferase 1